MSHLLDVKDLYVEFDTRHSVVKAVNGVSFSIDEGETIGLVGETGAGKTTTALAIMNLIPGPYGKITNGKITYKDEDLLKKTQQEMRKIRGGQISMIFQDPMTSLNPVITVGDQIEEVVRLHNKGMTGKEIHKKAVEMLELVGIPGSRFSEYPHQFSGGMRQRVIIAIALACNPSLLIADEPTTALDVTIQAQVLELMSNLKKNFNTSMILITHDLGVVAGECNKVAIIYAGEIVEFGTRYHIFKEATHPYTRGLFGAIPKINVETDRLTPIPGLMPDPTNLPKGCPFAPRCSYKLPICDEEHPKALELSDGHIVRCHLYTKEGQ